MKTTKPLPLSLRVATLLVAAIALFVTTDAFAAGPYYWDGNDNASGFGTASGTWAAPTTGTTTSGWSTDGTGATTVNGNSVTTGTTDALNFGNGATGLGAGTVTVSGTVNASTLTFGSGSGAIVLSGGTINLGSTTITPNNTSDTINSAISLNANSTIFSPLGNNGVLTLGGAISGGFNVTFGGLNTGASGQSILLNAASTYTGSTTIATAASSGANNIVQLGIDNALPTTTAFNIIGANGSSTSVRWARLDLNGHNQTLAAITINNINFRQQHIINTSAILGTLTVNNASADTFAGQIGYYGGPFTPAALGAGGSISYLGLTKQGAGKLTLNPTRYNNYYTGPTTISQGILEFAGVAQLAYGNTYTNTISIASGAALLFSGTAANPLGGAISGSGSLTNSGTGTVTLTNANAAFTGTMFAGNTTSGGATLALGASGDIGGATLVISPGGVFDTSAQSSYTLGGSATLSASGTGTSATTQAAIKGGTTVSFAAQPITLTWGGAASGTDSTHPCLVVTQGALTLNNNAFTVNGGSTLGVGVYTLISVTAGTINQSGSPSYVVSGSAINGGYNNVISVSGGSLILTVSPVGVASTNAYLASLVLNPAGTLTPAFNSNTLTYASSEAAGASVTLTAVRSESHATMQLIVNGGTPTTLLSGVASSPLALIVGGTTPVTVQVTAQDGVTITNYTVNITEPSASVFYWDNNGSTAGFGTTQGTWADPTTGGSTQGWSANSAGTAPPGDYSTSTNDTLNFGTAAAGLTTGTIAVSGTVNAGNLNFGNASGVISLSGGTINLADNATIAYGGDTNLAPYFMRTSAARGGDVATKCACAMTGAVGSLLFTNGGCFSIRTGQPGWGAGETATIAGDSQVNIYASAANGLGGSGGFTIQLGDAVSGGSMYVGNSVGIINNVVVAPGSGFRFISLYDNATTTGMNGNITAHTNFYFVYGASGNNGKTALVSGNDYVDSGVTVTYAMGFAPADRLSDTAIWDGPGNIAYTSAALTNVSSAFTNVVASSSAYFLISGAKTYSGGSSIYGFTNGSYCVVSGSSDTTPPNNGPFGTGTLTLGSGTVLRADIGGAGDSTLGNNITLASDVTFPTVASENSLIFQGNVSLGSTTRTLTCNVGTTVSGKMVDFQGVVFGTGGINMAGTGWLRLSGTNTYTGNTTVSAGTLDIALSSLATSSTVSVSNGAVLNLEFSTTNQVAAFITNGVSLPAGVYSTVNVSPFITGSGYLKVVSAGPSGPATITNSFSSGVLSLSWPAGQGWRLQQQTNSLSTGLSTNWVYVTDGSVSSTNITINATKPTVFYRLTYP